MLEEQYLFNHIILFMSLKQIFGIKRRFVKHDNTSPVCLDSLFQNCIHSLVRN